MSSHPDPDSARIRAAIESVQAPPSLRTWIAAEYERTAPRRARRQRMRWTGALAATAAAAGAALALVLPAGTPTVLQAAALAADGPTAAAPARDPAHPDRLTKAVDGVVFPTWSDRYSWRPSGQRADTLDGRRAVTVFYDDPGGERVAYTIVAGHSLDWPQGSQRVVRHGVEVHLLRRDKRIVATWREHGHQCVLSAPASVPQGRMIELASSDGAAGPSASTVYDS
jgi:hypothetical protein